MALTSPVIVDLKTLNSSNELEINMSHYRDFSILLIPNRPIYIDKITVEVLSPTGYTTLQENTDYLPILPFRAAIRSEGKAIYGALLMHEGYSGVTLRLTYIPIEEDYSVSSSTVYTYVEHRTDRIYEMSYDEIIEGTIDYPLRDSYQDYTSYLEKDALENELHLIAQAISLDNGTLTKLTNYINNTPIIAGQANTQINSKVLKTGSIMQGPIEVQSTPSDPNDAVTYGYLNTIQTQKQNNVTNLASNVNDLVNRSGDTLQGPLHLARDPVENNELATKNYVLSKASTIAPEDLPVGAVVLARKNWNQPGYLKCNGVELNKADYPFLYSTIRDTFSKKSDPGFGYPERNQYEFNDYEPNFDTIKEIVSLNGLTPDGLYEFNLSTFDFKVTKNNVYFLNNNIAYISKDSINNGIYEYNDNYNDFPTGLAKLDIANSGKVENMHIENNTDNYYVVYNNSFKIKNRIYYFSSDIKDTMAPYGYTNIPTSIVYRTINSDGTLSSLIYDRQFLDFEGYDYNVIVTNKYVYFLAMDKVNINEPSNTYVTHTTVPISYRALINDDGSFGSFEVLKNVNNIYYIFENIVPLKNKLYGFGILFSIPYYRSWDPYIYQAKILPNGEISSFKTYGQLNELRYQSFYVNSKNIYRVSMNDTDYTIEIEKATIYPDEEISSFSIVNTINLSQFENQEKINLFKTHFPNNDIYYYIGGIFATSSRLYIMAGVQMFDMPNYNYYYSYDFMISFDLLGGFNDYITYELPHVYYYPYINETPWNNQTLIDNITIPDSNFSTVNEVIDLYDGNGDNAFVFATKNKVYIYGLRKYDNVTSTTIYSNYVGDINADGSISALTPVTVNIDTSAMTYPYSFIYNNEAYIYSGYTDFNTVSTTYELYKAPIDNNGVIGNFTSISSYAYYPNNGLTTKFSFVYNDSLFTLINMGSLDSFGFRRINFKNGSENIPYGPFSFINLDEQLLHLIHKDQWVYLITKSSSDVVYRIYRLVLNSNIYDWSSVTLMSTLDITTSTVVDIYDIGYASTYITDNAIYFIGSEGNTVANPIVPSKILKLPIDSSGVVDFANLVQIGSLPSVNKFPKLVATSTRLYIFPGLNSDHVNYNGLYNKYYYIEANVGLTNYIVDEVQGPIVPNIKVPEQPDPDKFNIPELPDEGELSYYIKT